MPIDRWLNSSEKKGRRVKNRRRAARAESGFRMRPILEALEDRTAPAVTIVNVDTVGDIVDADDNVTSLREAVIDANNNTDDYEIRLQAGAYYLTRAGADEDAAVTGDLDILNNGSVKIVGAGPGRTIIHAGGDGNAIPALSDRVFHVLSGARLEVDAVAVTGGAAIAGTSTNKQGGGFYVDNGTLTLDSVIVTANQAEIGGGIANAGTDSEVTITGSTISANVADDGGGIANVGGRLTLAGSTLSANTASASGGGIYSVLTGSVTIASSTVSANRANDGGGIYNAFSGALTVLNSTLSGNQADTNGGGVNNDFFSDARINNSTVTGNRSDADGDDQGAGGGLYHFQGTTIVHNTIIAGNFRGAGTAAADIASDTNAVFTGTYNLIGDANTSGGLSHGVDGNIVGNKGSGTLNVNTLLDATLADNGGPTLTHALRLGSPALHAGDPNFDPDAYSPRMVTDQRGENRLAVGRIDIGAFELTQQDLLSELRVARGFFFTGNFYENYLGLSEKWFRDRNKTWYVIQSDGRIQEWLGGANLASPIAIVGSAVYDDPQLLFEAPMRLTQPEQQTLNQLRTDHGFYFTGNFFQDYLGLNEKWFRDRHNTWYAIQTDGRIREWLGGNDLASPLATVSPLVYDDPQLLFQAPVTDQLGRLRHDFGFHFSNSFFVNYFGLNEKWFRDRHRVWHIITPDGRIQRWHGGRNFSLVNTVDPQVWTTPNTLFTAPVTLPAPALTQIRQLQQQHAFHSNGNLFLNYSGLNEKWFQDAGDVWYIITSDGRIQRWHGGRNFSVLAIVDPLVYDDPLLLLQAAP